MHKVLKEKGKAVLLGNDAIVRGALESGVGLAAAYPGTPSSEIGDTFSEIAKDVGIYYEWSANEKVAAEVAAGAAFAGVRSMTFFKHFGFNVASDSVYPLAYHGVEAGMVIVSADDPAGWSSGQSEQDTRKMIQTAHMPYLEPCNAQECKDFTKIAFELSSKFKIPVFLRTTTRVNHSKGVVSLGEIVKGKTKGFFKKGKQWQTMPPTVIEVHKQLHEKLDELRQYSEKSPLNFIVNKEGRAELGIIASGVSFGYVSEAVEKLGVDIQVLRISMWPYPEKKIAEFMKGKRSILVVEELEPVLETEVKKVAQEHDLSVKIHGKNILPFNGEMRIEKVIAAIAKVTGMTVSIPTPTKLDVPEREPILCPGCPHRGSFWATKEALGKDCVWGGDIGCYILGIFEPMEMQDFIISMGAGTGISHGIGKVSDQKIVTFMGDSTFFHAGFPAIVNMIYNKANAIVIILDNRITAMTGHQPHPGAGYTGMGDISPELPIADILRACGASVLTVNPFSIKSMSDTIKRVANEKGVKVIISRQDCRLMFMRKARKHGMKVPVFQINQQKCKKCNRCIEYGCPAIHLELKGKKPSKYYIDEGFCWGCTVCAQVCPFGAIEVVK
jgi:indolepyruvate ferredoxin oxidoreductase alpha subunit